MAPGANCVSCGGQEIETDVSRGVSFCTGCGSVVESNVLVSGLEFQENACGSNSVVGQTVHFDGRGGARGNGFESRAVTLETGRRLIAEVAEQLRINQHHQDSAFGFYKMAVARRLTRGRPRQHSVAACLYMACRLQTTTHATTQYMLLDFSEVLQVNVWELGRCYLAFSNALHISIPNLDPCVYVIRFAHLLQLKTAEGEDRTQRVISTTMRLLQRMKKDWMHVGRRPSGLCGAALLVAARWHDFHRTPEDMVKVVRIGKATIRKRLLEFGSSPTAQLTLEEFQNVDLEGEMDPPSFTKNRKKDQLKEEEEEEQTKEVSRLHKKIERLLDKTREIKQKKLQEIYESSQAVEELDEDERETRLTEQFIEKETISAITKFVEESSGTSIDKEEEEQAIWDANFSGEAVGNIGLRAAGLMQGAPLTGTELLGTSSATAVSRKRPCEEEDEEDEEPKEPNEGILDLTGIDEKEIDSYIMSAMEIENKSAMWHVVNADYLKVLQEKEERMAELEKEGLVKPEKKKRQVKKKSSVPFSSADEAIQHVLKEKKISNKINYDVLRSLTPSTAAILPASSATPAVPVSATIPTPVQPPEPEKPVSQPTRKPKLSKEDGTIIMVPEPVITGVEDMPLVVEDGPMTYNNDDDDYHEDDYEEDEDGNPIARQKIQCDDDGFEDYDDDD